MKNHSASDTILIAIFRVVILCMFGISFGFAIGIGVRALWELISR